MSEQHSVQCWYGSCMVSSKLYEVNLREEVDNFHRVQPYNERQKDLIKKHLMKGSTEPKVHKIEFALRFMSLITRIISI